MVQFDPSNVASAIKDSNVDAIMSVGPVGSSITADAIAAATRGKEPPTFLAIDAAEAIAEREPVYEASEIKAGAFGGSPQRPEESVETIEVQPLTSWRARSSSEQSRRRLHQASVRDPADARGRTAVGRQDREARHRQGRAVPVHPGAAAYLDGELKTFFDRYSDLLYWGLMLVSFFGSALRRPLSYSKADDRVRRLQDAGAAAGDRQGGPHRRYRSRRSTTCRRRSTTIQGDMIREVEANTLDETALMAYAMSIEQAQLAISDRRAALDGPAAAAPRGGCVAVIHRYIAPQQHPLRRHRGP